MINRIPTFSHLKKDVAYSIESIDQLLFENIPGKIISKRTIEKNGWQGLDIKNRLKNGDHQRYQIFLTPLEVFIFKMGGEGDFVSKHSDPIFNSLHFKAAEPGRTRVVSGFEDFELDMPNLYRFTNRFRAGNRLIEGYDGQSKAYYFLRKASLNDFNFIEQDTFELKQIQKRFYQDLELKPVYESFSDSSLRSRAIQDSVSGRTLYLKTFLEKGNYYLLGSLGATKEGADNFFASFKTKSYGYPETFKHVRDTAMLFSTLTPLKPPKFVEGGHTFKQGGKKIKSYSPYTKKSVYQHKNNEAITIELTKAHDYLTFPSIDSVWTLRKKQYAHKKFNIIREQAKSSPRGYYQLDLTLTDTASTRGILIRNVLKGGLLYELKTSVDTLETPGKFVRAFFDNFQPADTLVGRDILEDKTSDFFAALRANDSIVLEGYRLLHFDERHIDSLQYYISEFDYPTDKKHIQSHLIQKMGQLDHPGVFRFFKELYLSSYNNSWAQIKILQAIAAQKDEASTRLLLELLSKDIPLVSNTLEVSKIFSPYRDTLALAKNLYPELLDYSGIQEYKAPIFSLLAKLKSEKHVKPKMYKSNRKQLLADAQIQLKRYLGKQNSGSTPRRYYQQKRSPNTILEDYAQLLYPYAEEKDMQQFFRRLTMVRDPKIKTTFASLIAQNNVSIPNGIFYDLAADINSRSLLFRKLKDVQRLDLFPKAFLSQRSLAEANLFEKKKYNALKDSLAFVKQQSLQFEGKEYQAFYFKLRNKRDYDKNFKMHLLVFPESAGPGTKAFYKNEGYRIEDTDTDEEAVNYVTEVFLLKNRKRAKAYRPNYNNRYGSFEF